MTLLEFNDPRIAQVAFRALCLKLDKTTVEYTSPKVLTCFRGLDAGNISDYEGELAVTAYWDEVNKPIAEQDLCHRVESSLAAFGPIKAFDRFPVSQTRIREFRVEFYDIRSTSRALAERHGITSLGITLKWQPYQPDIVTSTVDSSITSSSQSIGSSSIGSAQPSLTGRSMMPSTAAMAIPNSLNSNIGLDARRIRGGTDNTINVKAIINGEDIRTTVMLRNIPNRVDCHMLKSLLDETSFGKYDFAYLRIDFQNQCNVGYAFINFSEAIHIVPFAQARQKQRWGVFDSDKVAEISYASKSSETVC